MSEIKSQVFNEDCMETMKRIPDGSIDLMLTDIPYGVTNYDWDTKPNLNKIWAEWNRILKHDGAFIFTSTQPLTTELISSNKSSFKYELIWDKVNHSSPAIAKIQPLRMHENILVFYRSQPCYNPQFNKTTLTERRGKKSSTRSGHISGFLGNNYQEMVGYPKSIIRFQKPSNMTPEVGNLHPSQKPLDLFRYLILTYTNPGDTVYDGYLGSGTTAVASLMEGRNFIGSELDKGYFDLCQNRIQNHISQLKLELK